MKRYVQCVHSSLVHDIQGVRTFINLRDAAAFQQAADIRKYVETIRLTQACDGFSTVGEFERWSQWALAQTGRIDPANGGAFLKATHDEDEVKK